MVSNENWRRELASVRYYVEFQRKLIAELSNDIDRVVQNSHELFMLELEDAYGMRLGVKLAKTPRFEAYLRTRDWQKWEVESFLESEYFTLEYIDIPGVYRSVVNASVQATDYRVTSMIPLDIIQEMRAAYVAQEQAQS